RLAAVLLDELVERGRVLPEFEDGPFLGWEIDLCLYLVERHKGRTSARKEKEILASPLVIMNRSCFPLSSASPYSASRPATASRWRSSCGIFSSLGPSCAW